MCDHTTGRWEDVYQYDDWETGEPVYERQWVTRSTLEDIDVHRMRCRLCGAIEYYSGAARAYYEEGKRNEIVELGIAIDGARAKERP